MIKKSNVLPSDWRVARKAALAQLTKPSQTNPTTYSEQKSFDDPFVL